MRPGPQPRQRGGNDVGRRPPPLGPGNDAVGVRGSATTEGWTLPVEAGDTLPVSKLWDSTGHVRPSEKQAELHELMRAVQAGIDRDIAAVEPQRRERPLYVGQRVTPL